MKKKNNFVAIILARGGSNGIKQKNLIKVNKKPLIFWTLKHCLSSKKISSIWVSSDSEKILNYSCKIGAKTIKRPKTFSKDNSTSEIAWLHAIRYIQKKGIQVNNVIALQPTSPIRFKKDLDKAINLFVKEKYDSLFTAQKIHDFFTWQKTKNKLVPNYSYRLRPRRQKIKGKYMENGSFYIFNKNRFMKSKNRLFGKIGIYEMSKICSFQIDDLIDIKIINLLKQYF